MNAIMWACTADARNLTVRQFWHSRATRGGRKWNQLRNDPRSTAGTGGSLIGVLKCHNMPIGFPLVPAPVRKRSQWYYLRKRRGMHPLRKRR
jgi:hypothetical protein